MIEHVVMWQVKDSYEDMNKEDILLEMKNQLMALPEYIPEIKSFSVVFNTNKVANNMDVSLLSSFEDLEALNRYIVHPEHKKVASFVSQVVLSRAAIDYDI